MYRQNPNIGRPIYLSIPSRKPICSCGSNGSMIDSIQAQMSLSRNLKGTYSRDMGQQLFGSPSAFSDLGIKIISALLQIFRIFSWRMQELKEIAKTRFESRPGVEYNSGKMESSPGNFPGFRRLRAAARSSGLRGSEILWPSCVGIFHKSDSFLLISLKDSLYPVLCGPFLVSCEAMLFAQQHTGERSVQICQWVCWWCSTLCCCDRKPEQQVHKVSHCGSKQQWRSCAAISYYCMFAPRIYIVILRSHAIRGESHIQHNATGEVATPECEKSM